VAFRPRVRRFDCCAQIQLCRAGTCLRGVQTYLHASFFPTAGSRWPRAVATTRVPSVKVQEYRAIGLVSAAPFRQPFPEPGPCRRLFPFLSAQLGFGFIELGFGTERSPKYRLGRGAIAGLASLVDRLGSRRMLIAALGSPLANCLCRVPASPYPIIGCCWRWCCSAVSNSVFQTRADYAVLVDPPSPPSASARAFFHFHTFAGFPLGNAVAPFGDVWRWPPSPASAWRSSPLE